MAVPPALLESPVPELPPPNTIIDFLSANVEYSYFLRHVQRLGLVPRINKMANVTLFAPINLAFVDSEIAKNDTIESVLRYFTNLKFRVATSDHMVTVLDSMYTITKADTKLDQLIRRDFYVDPDDLEDDIQNRGGEDDNSVDDVVISGSDATQDNQKITDNLSPLKKAIKYFPLLISHRESTGDGRNLRINNVAEIVEADNYLKHQHSYVHGIDRLIPAKPSMCEFLMNKNLSHIDKHSVSFIGGIFRLLFAPRRVGASEKPLMSGDNFPRTCDDFVESASTLFLPTDAYIDSSLLSLEKRYFLTLLHGLENPALYPTKEAVYELKTDAFALILKILLADQVLESSGKGNYSSLDGSMVYNVSGNVSTGQLTINEKLTSLKGFSSLALSDGLIHLFDKSSSDSTNPGTETNPSDFFQALNVKIPAITPRKALYAMHFSQMVREFKFRKLGKFLGHKAFNQTILLDMSDRDDVKEDDEIESQDFVHASSFSSRQQLLYRFLNTYVDIGAELSPEKSVYHEILDSKLCLKKKIGSCYKTKVWGSLDKNNEISVSFNDKFLANLPVLAANNNAIYFSENDYEAPASFKRVMAGLISDGIIWRHQDQYKLDKDACLETLNYLDSYDLILLYDNHHGYTVFLPCGGRTISDISHTPTYANAWQQMGLVLKYLQKHPNEFKFVLEGMFLENLLYSHLEGTERTSQAIVKSLNGKNVNVTRAMSSDKERVYFNLNETEFPVPTNSEVIFTQGVVHITDKVLLPSDFHISMKKLVQTTEEQEFPENSFFRLLEKFPNVEKQLDLDLDKSEYSLFVPTPDLLHWKNITANYRRLNQLLQMHTIPKSQLQTLLDCISDQPNHANNANYTLHTNHTNAIFRCQISPTTGKAYLTFQKPLNSISANTKTQRVTILSHGCTYGINNGSCVFLIDVPINPGWFDVPDNFLYVHIGWISVCIGIIIGVILFGFCTTTLVLCLSNMDQKRKSNSFHNTSQTSLFAPTEASYMRITSDEDMDNNDYDYGYETDNDMMGDDERAPLPKRGKNSKKGFYGTLSPVGTPSAPLMIDRENLKKAFNRERHLPGI